MGIPAAPVVSGMFRKNASEAAYKRGMPLQRISFAPHPVAFQPLSLHREYAEGHDPVTGKPLMPQIVEALTKGPSADEQKTGVLDRTPQRLMIAESEEKLQELFLDHGWTDGIPIVPPTEQRVAEMLQGTSHRADKVLPKMSPATAGMMMQTSKRTMGCARSRSPDSFSPK